MFKSTQEPSTIAVEALHLDRTANRVKRARKVVAMADVSQPAAGAPMVGQPRSAEDGAGDRAKPDRAPRHRLGTGTKRSLVKALTYRVAIVCLDFVAVYLLTGKTTLALGFMIVSNVYTTVGYFLHERIWAHIEWGRHAWSRRDG